MTRIPEHHQCDWCTDRVAAEEMVTLHIGAGPASSWITGYVGHYHSSCWAEVWEGVAEVTEFYDRDHSDVELHKLEEIPVATEWEIASERSTYTKAPPAEGQRPILVGDDDSLLRVLEKAKIPTRYNVPIGSLTQAARMTDGELRALRGIGPKAIRAIREAARARGLTTDPRARMEG